MPTSECSQSVTSEIRHKRKTTTYKITKKWKINLKRPAPSNYLWIWEIWQDFGNKRISRASRKRKKTAGSELWDKKKYKKGPPYYTICTYDAVIRSNKNHIHKQNLNTAPTLHGALAQNNTCAEENSMAEMSPMRGSKRGWGQVVWGNLGRGWGQVVSG